MATYTATVYTLVLPGTLTADMATYTATV
jgi:hypothetical protein